MKKLLLAILFISQIAFSQVRTEELKPFNSIHITSAMEVELIVSNTNKIEISGSDHERLIIKVEDEELLISNSIDKKFKSDLKVKIYYQNKLDELSLSNKVDITSEDVLNSDFLEIKAVNGVYANLSIENKNLEVNLSLGSNIVLKGTTESQKIKASTKSFYDTFNLKSKKAYVDSNTSNVGVYVTDFLDASAKYKGEIIYMGNPTTVNKNTFLGGTISKKE